jgi:glyoxylase-like metal-dependent hydrolase (beta-lactamase superfamily II)
MINKYRIVKLKLQSGILINYSYIIYDEATKNAAIIDPSWETEKICFKIDELKLDLRHIYLTHSHYDHIYSVQTLIDKYNPAVYMSDIEIQYYKYSCKNLFSIKHLQKLNLGTIEIICLVTPGHTAGSTCYLLNKDIFTGDTLFVEVCGICHGDGGSAEAMYYSLQMLKSAIKLDVNIFPGHRLNKDLGQSFEYVLNKNIYLQINNKEQFVKMRMSTAKSNKHLVFL